MSSVYVYLCLAYYLLIVNHYGLMDKLLGRECRKDFTNYAYAYFKEFGDGVLYWNTVNKPNAFTIGGYDQGTTPPQHCSPPFCVNKSTRGNSTYEPYLALHHILLAHSSAVRLYRRK